MIVVSMLPYGKFGPNDHREGAPHFTNQIIWQIFGVQYINFKFILKYLKKAFWNQNNEYDLWLAADHGMDNQRQWFFFQVKNMKQNTVYR